MKKKVLYEYGAKAKYLSLTTRLDNVLYFCTDTKELFKGDHLYSGSVRVVSSYSALPSFDQAADETIYICSDDHSGYIVNRYRDAWIQVISGVDGETIVIENGKIKIADDVFDLSGSATDALKQAKKYVDNISEEIREIAQSVRDDADAGRFDGNVMYATFDIEPETMELVMETPDAYAGPRFTVNEKGEMEVEI